MDPLSALEEDGYAVVPAALTGAQLDELRAAHSRVAEQERRAGRAAADGSVHLLGFLGRHPAFLDLVDVPCVLSLVARTLGWNIHVYHCHLDAHPRLPVGRMEQWRWHQDGGRQNLELEGEPRPRLSVKVAYALSDLINTGCGSMLVIPGSHRANTLERGSGGRPAGTVELRLRPGDAVVFDRRLWHARSDNLRGPTRRLVFLAYGYRWLQPRDHLGLAGIRVAGLPPLRRQLLGHAGTPLERWTPSPADTPMHAWLAARGLLDAGRPAHR